MNFREESRMVYEESLKGYGISDKMIDVFLRAFDTGFSAGILNDNSREDQVKMLNALLNEEVVN